MLHFDPTPSGEYQRESFQDDVSSRLVDLALAALNRREVAGKRRLSASNSGDVENLVSFLISEADARFRDYYTDQGAPNRGQDKLLRERLLDTMENRAKWILKHWRPDFKEQASKWGKSSMATTGTRKGRVPKFKLFHILPHMDLPPKERKAIVLAETGMSPARYYVLLKQVPAAQARLAEQVEANRAAGVENLKLIEDVEVIEPEEVTELDVKSDVEPFVPTDPWDRSFAELNYLERLIAEEVAEKLAKARPALDELVASL